MLNPVEQSLGERATFIGGVAIQAPTLLGPREVVGSAANTPPSMQYWRGSRPVHAALSARRPFRLTVQHSAPAGAAEIYFTRTKRGMLGTSHITPPLPLFFYRREFPGLR